MFLLFCSLSVAFAIAWLGYRRSSIAVFLFSLAFAVVWFLHHVTSHINIDL